MSDLLLSLAWTTVVDNLWYFKIHNSIEKNSNLTMRKKLATMKLKIDHFGQECKKHSFFFDTTQCNKDVAVQF